MKSLEHQERENAKRSSQAFFTKKKLQQWQQKQQKEQKNFFTSYISSHLRGIHTLTLVTQLSCKNYMRLSLYQVEVMKMKQLAKISFHFVSNQYLMQISGIKFIMPILLVFYVMALQNWGLLKKIYIYILLVNPDTFKVKVAFLHSKMGYCKICRAFIQSLNQLSKTQFCSTYCLKLCF